MVANHHPKVGFINGNGTKFVEIRRNSLPRGKNLVQVMNDVIGKQQNISRDFLSKFIAFWDFSGFDVGFL